MRTAKVSFGVCRMCLANNIRMRTLANSELQDLFEKLTSIKLIADEGMPKTVCNMCISLLQRFYKFVEVSQRSEKFLTQLLQDGIEFTQETLSRTKGGIQNMLQNLSVSNTTFVSIPNSFKEKKCKVTVKTEPEDEYYVFIENENAPKLEIPVGKTTFKKDIGKCLLISPEIGENSKTFETKQNQICCTIKCDKPVYDLKQQNKSKKVLKEETKTLTNNKGSGRDIKNDNMPTLVKHPNFENIETIKKKTESDDSKTIYKCNLCPKEFRQKWYLKRHTSFHDGVKPYICNICAAGFTSPVLLKQHKKGHSKRPFFCQNCSKQFGSKAHYNEHMRTHTGEKPHTCNVCFCTFAHRGSLTRHKRTHNGERPYVCQKCPKTFIQISNFKRHTRVCQGGYQKKSVCGTCHS